jgi:hypothetical protein
MSLWDFIPKVLLEPLANGERKRIDKVEACACAFSLGAHMLVGMRKHSKKEIDIVAEHIQQIVNSVLVMQKSMDEGKREVMFSVKDDDGYSVHIDVVINKRGFIECEVRHHESDITKL